MDAYTAVSSVLAYCSVGRAPDRTAMGPAGAGDAARRRAPQRARQVCSPERRVHSGNATRHLSVAASMCNIRCKMQFLSSSTAVLRPQNSSKVERSTKNEYGFYKLAARVRARYDTSQSSSGTAPTPPQPHSNPQESCSASPKHRRQSRPARTAGQPREQGVVVARRRRRRTGEKPARGPPKGSMAEVEVEPLPLATNEGTATPSQDTGRSEDVAQLLGDVDTDLDKLGQLLGVDGAVHS